MVFMKSRAAPIAADLRFRAVLMTAFSFILGVIPLVIASGAAAARKNQGRARIRECRGNPTGCCPRLR